ncbi:MAG: hypothetical protein ACT4PL_04290 [Phycisphaerales bacterium]
MSQTFAIFVDAYRELNSRKLFWISIILSLLVVGVFGCLGINERGLRILWFDVPFDLNTNFISELDFYKLMFAQFGVSFWLGWVCTILAIVSTAGIVPDLVTGGSVELMLSKPIGRARLFLTKYAAGLMFATLQVVIFTAAAFIVIGLRGGEWIPSLFLAVPLVICFFSYLFSVCALIGMVTRSTVASIMLTLIFWFALFALHTTEQAFLSGRAMKDQQVGFAMTDLDARRLQLTRAEQGEAAAVAPSPGTPGGDAPPADGPAGGPPKGIVGTISAFLSKAQGAPRASQGSAVETLRKNVATAEEKVTKLREDALWWQRWHSAFYAVRTVLPKTDETKQLLERTIASEAGMKRFMDQNDQPSGRRGRAFDGANPVRAARVVEEENRRRSMWWVIGTSLLFEGAVLGLATILFRRRDF